VSRLLSPAPALAALPFVPGGSLAQEQAAPVPDGYGDAMARNARWREGRFGRFIHFGACAVELEQAR
jgi:hypothetical protein